jgi:hypothetical protein
VTARWQRVITPIMRRFRTRRMRQFEAAFRPTAGTRIVDVGGLPLNWQLIASRPQLTLVNLTSPVEPLPPNVQWVVADARSLPFRDGTFDIAYSNSVIEHIPSADGQRAMAIEMARVAQRYYLQTPNRAFPVEPHLMTPFIHYLPRRFQRRLWRNCTVWGLVTRPTPAVVQSEVAGIRLLDARDLRRLMPSASILRERVLGLPKSR